MERKRIMRKRIIKDGNGRGTTHRKEVSLRVNKSGLSADGNQRYVIAIRFAESAIKKASSSQYVAVEVDDETNRLYFVTAEQNEGYKLTASGKGAKVKSITFSVRNIESWRPLVGDYDMKKDVSDNTYYIDIAECPEV